MRTQRQNERDKNLDALSKEHNKSKKEVEADFDQPIGLSFLTSIFNGIQLNVKHVHIRYEDDYFSKSRPFSMGFLIDEIDLGNTKSHWTFHTANGMRFTRH